MDKISVIIPIYNTLEFVENSINSVLEQTYENIEIILINDGSNQEVKEVLTQYTKRYNQILLYNLIERKGVGAARNYGITKATGEFIYFLDSDDYLSSNTLELLVKNIEQYKMIRGEMKTTTFSNEKAISTEKPTTLRISVDKKFHLIKNRSALNLLIRKDFVEKYNFRFSENIEIFSDLQFLIPAFIVTPVVPYLSEAIYFRRKRNDSISNPSLSQFELYKQVPDFLHAYKELKHKYENEDANQYLDKQFLSFYRKEIVTCFKKVSYVDTFYPMLRESMKLVDLELIKESPWVLRTEARAILQGRQAKYKRLIKRHQLLREVKVALKGRTKLYIFLYKRVFQKMKIKNNIVFFESFLGKNYSDSPKYIYEKMLEKNMDYKYIWCFKERKDIPGNAIQVKRFSLRYYYYLARAKYWVSNSRIPKSLNKREENIYLQTWHGTPLKRLVFDMNDVHSADPNYKKNFYQQSRRWDYLSSPNPYSSKIFRRAFKFDKTMLEFGYPRNDILYQKNNEKDINILKDQLGIPKDKKVILYAPTWRDDEFFSKGNYKFTLKLDLAKMQKSFGNEYIILLRTHYFIANQLDVSGFEGFVYDVAQYDDIAELYLMSDILITDYSSVFFDYANLKRPILFYTYDLEKYQNTLRGMYINMETGLPGPLLMTTDEVVHSISNIDKVMNEYKDRYDAFYQDICTWDDGCASEKTIEAVFKG